MIFLDNVSKYYPHEKVPALDEVTLHIAPKEFVFIVGASGAGKSTLIKMLTREEKPNYGKIIVGGIDYDYMKKRHIPHIRRRLGVVFQDFAKGKYKNADDFEAAMKEAIEAYYAKG